MPTNLPPECAELEQRYREARTAEERIARLEELLGAIPKHKGTDHLRADYRRKLSKLKTAAQSKKGVGRVASPYRIDREGAGQVVLVGPTNVGKSALVAALTNASPEVAETPYTTWAPTPGMMDASGIPIQLIDTPPLDLEYIDPEFLNLIRQCSLLWLVVNLQGYPLEELETTVAMLQEHRILPGHWQGRIGDERRPAYVPMLVVVNQHDDAASDDDCQVLCELLAEEWPLVSVSAATGRNLDYLKQVTVERLELIRLYAKPPGREPDLSAPFVVKRGTTVEEFAQKVHRDFYDRLKTARVWGSAAFDGQPVGRDHVLQDGDIVELRI